MARRLATPGRFTALFVGASRTISTKQNTAQYRPKKAAQSTKKSRPIDQKKPPKQRSQVTLARGVRTATTYLNHGGRGGGSVSLERSRQGASRRANTQCVPGTPYGGVGVPGCEGPSSCLVAIPGGPKAYLKHHRAQLVLQVFVVWKLFLDLLELRLQRRRRRGRLDLTEIQGQHHQAHQHREQNDAVRWAWQWVRCDANFTVIAVGLPGEPYLRPWGRKRVGVPGYGVKGSSRRGRTWGRTPAPTPPL